MKVYAFSLIGNLENFKHARTASTHSSGIGFPVCSTPYPYGCGVLFIRVKAFQSLLSDKHRLHTFFCIISRKGVGRDYFKYFMHNYLECYLAVAKELKKRGALNPNDDKVMDEIYNRIADYYVRVFGETKRVELTFIIQKRFESELLL